jgi:hypothetical protein
MEISGTLKTRFLMTIGKGKRQRDPNQLATPVEIETHHY